ncbi:Rieske 2Fe-2S domain-containing protein [Alicyclobacillus acidoterrestris]|uniref:Rieske 2Fe-2S domain-containing protein n=1 Tax=Alicyclobacillus acidoterrestris TaxID=1450 RepID=UPI003F52E3E1
MLHDVWYAACQAADVTTDPRMVTILDHPYVLYRSPANQLVAVDGYCPHRGCDLSIGHVDNGELVCPFHGWRFDKTGQCTRIPANRADTPIPKRFRLTTYPVLECSGMVWIYTGNQDINSSELPSARSFATFPELTDENWRGVPFQQTWKAHFTRVVESVIDVSHLPFVHPEVTGTDVDPTVDGPEYHVRENVIVIHPTPFAPSHPMEPVHPEQTSTAKSEIELRFPNQWIIRTPFGDHGMMCTFLTFTPINDHVTQIFGLALRNFDHDAPWLDDFHIDHTIRVMEEDQRIIESIRPKIAPFALRDECHVASDVPTIRYRVMLANALEQQSTRRSSSTQITCRGID